MKKTLSIALLLFVLTLGMYAQGLRHSVCIVEPELTETDKALIGDYALYMARAGMKSAARTLTAYKSEGTYGSGVLIEQDGKKYILTNLHVVGYAQTATITFQLHEKTLRYTHCRVISTSLNSDLAALELPKDCEMLPLNIYPSETAEELAVVAAGFPELANKPSWQLTRGYISNARLENMENSPASHIIQHTASIDSGSSGGPLLFKNEEGKYNILGINTWKAFYREGVGLAIGQEDIRVFLHTLNTPSSEEHKALVQLGSTKGEDWIYIFNQLPDSTQKELRDMNWRLPLDPAQRTLAIRDSLVQQKGRKSKHFERSKTHIIKDRDSNNQLRLLYDNYFRKNQQITLQWGYQIRGYFLMGLQVSALLAENNTAQMNVGPMFGAFIGGQLPISVGKFILAPRLTQSASGGPLLHKGFDSNFAILTDTHIGLDWRVPMSFGEFILGIHYNMDWMWTENNMSITPHKPASPSSKFNQYLQHGIGISLGISW